MSYKKKGKKSYQRQQVIAKVQAKLKAQKKRKPKQVGKAEAKAGPAPRALPPGKRLTLHFKHGKVKVTAKVRYETEKTEPLVKTALVADGVKVNKRYIGPRKREAYIDAQGEEHAKKDVQVMQVLPDGKTIPVKKERTESVKVTAIDEKVADEFHPYSHLEIWGEDDEDVDALREIAWILKSEGKAGAVKAFSHGYGRYCVGFIKPVISEDSKKFVLEMMLAENRIRRRRWMLTEAGEAIAKKPKAKEPLIPDLF